MTRATTSLRVPAAIRRPCGGRGQPDVV